MRVVLAMLALLTMGADFAPLTEADKAAIRQAIKRELTDPDSAQFRWNPERRDSVIYCGFVNSRNRFGGYAGFTLYEVMIDQRGVFLVQLVRDDTDAIVVETMCSQRGYNLDPSDPATVDD